MEIYSVNNRLVDEAVWKYAISSLKGIELEDNEEAIATTLRVIVEKAVMDRLANADKVGIMFSGGLDSSYIAAICKKLGADFTCYTVGFKDGNFKDPDDVVAAKKVAETLGLNFKYKVFDIGEMEQLFKETIKILDAAHVDKNVVNVGVAAVEYAAFSISDKEKYFFSGLGSEEIYAGYDRHKKNPTNEECYQGLLKMHDRDLVRDSAMSKTLGFEFKTPFLDKHLIKYSLAIPIKYKLNNSGNKLILRKAAYPLLKDFSVRPKKAAQYGSSFDKALEKLARKHGFELKKDYINSL